MERRSLFEEGRAGVKVRHENPLRTNEPSEAWISNAGETVIRQLRGPGVFRGGCIRGRLGRTRLARR